MVAAAVATGNMDDDFDFEPTAFAGAFDDMTDEEAIVEIQRILDKFVAMGVCETKIMEDGERAYRLTEVGRAFYESMQKGATLN